MKARLLFLSLVLLLCGCGAVSVSSNSVESVEQPHLYWQDIECVVTDCEYRYWYASGTHFNADVTVYSAEYDLTESFHLTGSDAQKCESLSEGDTIVCELYSWVMDSTGEVVRREITNIK